MKTRRPQSNLAACLVPWTESFEFDVETFDRHCRYAIEEGYKDAYVFGTAGEGFAVGDRQFRDVVRRFARNLSADGMRPQVGVISLSMAHVIERIEFARGEGIRSFQISLPSWGALSDAEVMAFFTGVCGRFPDCEFLHYNLPRTKRVLRGADYRRVADAVPNLAATKNSTSDYARVADLMREAPDLQHFFLEGGFAFGCMWGECSLLCSFGLISPKTTWRFFEAGRTKDWPTLWSIHKEMNEYANAMFAGVEGDYIDAAYDKTLARLVDERFSNRLLPPYQGLTEAQTEKVVAAYRIWQSRVP